MRKFSLFTLAVAFCMCSNGSMAQGIFTHPGLMHSEKDFERIREALANNDAQAISAFNVLKNSWIANKNVYDIWGVTEIIKRGIAGDENYMNAYRNAAKAYQCALLWKITGEREWANKALYVLNQYSLITKSIGGNSNQSLIPGFIGYQFLNAAELMRDCEYWAKEDFERFKQWMIDVWFTSAQDFLERRHDTVTREGNWYHYHSNWGLGNALFCVSLGVFCDLPDIYNYGMYWIKQGPGNESLYVGTTHPENPDPSQGMCGYGWGLIPWFHQDDRGPLGYLNQMQESGRDQGHAMAALGLLSYSLQTAFNQGDNAFCNLYNPLIPGDAGKMMVAGAAEYVAMFNSMNNNIPAEAEIIASIPYKQNWWMAGLNWTGQGQYRPIWQLFINHYQNKMGIPMQYCRKMKNKMGIEAGGGSYGTNSGGFDHTGFGDLMYYDKAVTEETRPTVLSPEIKDADKTYPYAELRNITKGTELTLKANLPEGEDNTGKWKWEDGVEGQSRTVIADKSGIYRVTYTNSKGIESTQMFCLSVYGEGIRATLKPWIQYDRTRIDGDSVIYAVTGHDVTLGADYANWNYIKATRWYDSTGKIISVKGTHSFTQASKDQTFVFEVINESGVSIKKTFKVINSLVETSVKVDDEVTEGTSVIIPQGKNVTLKGEVTSARYRNGKYKWSSGETTDSLYFENLMESVYPHLDWADSSTTNIREAHFDFRIQVYKENRSIEDGYYHIKDAESGLYFSNKNLVFEEYNETADSTEYVWHITWDEKAGRYKIQNHDDSHFLDRNGTFNSSYYSYVLQSFYIDALTGEDEPLCYIRNSERGGSYFWTIADQNLVCDATTERPYTFPFILERIDQNATDIKNVQSDNDVQAIRYSLADHMLELETESKVQVGLFDLSGKMINMQQYQAGDHKIDLSYLRTGIYIIRIANGNEIKTLKFVR